jgi:hypothetical protein
VRRADREGVAWPRFGIIRTSLNEERPPRADRHVDARLYVGDALWERGDILGLERLVCEVSASSGRPVPFAPTHPARPGQLTDGVRAGLRERVALP